jgi:hypothetical protein
MTVKNEIERLAREYGVKADNGKPSCGWQRRVSYFSHSISCGVSKGVWRTRNYTYRLGSKKDANVVAS